MVKAHVFISGKVQAVSYRVWVKRMATELGLNGWVRNLEDGRVEATFEGLKEQVTEMVERCKVGSRHAEVSEIEVSWEEPEGLVGFEIVR